MVAMMPKVNTASSAAEAMPSRDSGQSIALGGEFENILSSIEGSESKSSVESEEGVDHKDDCFEVIDDKNTTNSDEVQSTDESDTSTAEVSEEDLYNTLIEIMQSLIAQIESLVGSQSVESGVDGMQENLDEKLQKLNELVSTMKGRANGESLFDSSAFNTDLSSGRDDQKVVLQQVLKETEILKSFTEIDKKQLNDLTSILNRELGKKSDQDALSEKVQSLVDPENIKIETKTSNDNLSSKLRVDQLFHTLRANVNQDGARSAESLLADRVKSSDESLIPNQLSPEKLENAKSALENLLDSVRIGSLQSNVSNVGTGNPEIDSKNNRVMTSQILPRIETALKAGESNFKMTLSPHGLGQVEVKLLLEGGNLKVQLLASSSTTAELLAAQIDELKTALGTKDIQVTNSGHNQDFADDRNSEFNNEFFKQDEERKNRESDSSQNSENKTKNPSDIGERVEAKLVNAKTREGNLLGRI